MLTHLDFCAHMGAIPGKWRAHGSPAATSIFVEGSFLCWQLCNRVPKLHNPPCIYGMAGCTMCEMGHTIPQTLIA